MHDEQVTEDSHFEKDLGLDSLDTVEVCPQRNRPSSARAG